MTVATSTLLYSFLSVQVGVKFEMQRHAEVAEKLKTNANVKCVKKKKKRQRVWSKEEQVEGEGYVGGGTKLVGRTGKMRQEVREGGGVEEQVRCSASVLHSQLRWVTHKKIFAQTDTALHVGTLHGVSEVSGRGTRSEKSDQTPLNLDSVTRPEKEKGSTRVD